ncbi:MAG: molybdopterin-binding protein [Gaiellaceae bacterium]
MASETTYSAGEAARLLGISLDTLRRWDRAGRIRVKRDAANRRFVEAGEIRRLRGGAEAHPSSARNRFQGTVSDVKVEGLLAQVEIRIEAPARVVAVITREAAEELGLQPGSPATAVVKATSVMVEG